MQYKVLPESQTRGLHFVNWPVRGMSRSVHVAFLEALPLTVFHQFTNAGNANGRGPQSASVERMDPEENMSRERVNDFAFGLGNICLIVLVGAAILGAFLATQTFVTQYSVVAERYTHLQMPGR